MDSNSPVSPIPAPQRRLADNPNLWRSNSLFAIHAEEVWASFQEEFRKLAGYPEATLHIETGTPGYNVSGALYYSITSTKGFTEEYKARHPLATLTICCGYLSPFNGCCGIAMSYHVRTDGAFQRKGLGALMLRFRMALAKRAGYGKLIATCVDSNSAEEKLLTRAGWAVSNRFTNPRTKHEVRIWTVDL